MAWSYPAGPLTAAARAFARRHAVALAPKDYAARPAAALARAIEAAPEPDRERLRRLWSAIAYEVDRLTVERRPVTVPAPKRRAARLRSGLSRELPLPAPRPVSYAEADALRIARERDRDQARRAGGRCAGCQAKLASVWWDERRGAVVCGGCAVRAVVME